MDKSKAPYWLPKSLQKTVGGQTVGHQPLHCESFGGSDYCRHCGRDMCTATGKPNICYELERVRLSLIPDKEVLAFGCALEAACVEKHPDDVIHCKKWCHRPECAFTLSGAMEQEAINKEPENSP